MNDLGQKIAWDCVCAEVIFLHPYLLCNWKGDPVTSKLISGGSFFHCVLDGKWDSLGMI